jgi:membrane-bound ClpP family serine protease
MTRRLDVRRQFLISCLEEAVIGAFLVATLLVYRPSYVPLALGGLGILFAVKFVLFPWNQPATGAESMIGAEAEVVEDLDPEGMVKFEGVLWVARSVEGRICRGERGTIVRVSGSKLDVARETS